MANTFGDKWAASDVYTAQRANRKSLAQLTGSEISALFFSTGLVSQYAFAGNANDSVGSNNLTANGAPGYSANGGPDGQYIDFNGTNQYLVAGSSAVHDQTTNDFSISGWICVNAIGADQVIVAKRGSVSTNAGYDIWITAAGKLYAELCDSSASRISLTANTVLSASTWYFFAFVWDRDGNITIYLNGVSDGSASITTQQGSITNSQLFTVARNSAGSSEYLAGRMDDLRVWNKALSAMEVKQIMNDCRGGMVVECTESGSSFTKDHVYIRNAENTVWDEIPKTSAPTLTSPDINTDIELKAQAELRLADADSSNYVGLKAPGTVSTNKVWTMPSADGSSKQVLSTDGSAGLSFINMSATLINANDTAASASLDGTSKTIKTYGLAANSYSKIFAIATGKISLSSTEGNGSVAVSIGIGASTKSKAFNYPDWASGHSGTLELPFTIFLTATQTGSATISVKADSGESGQSVTVYDLYVYGMQ